MVDIDSIQETSVGYDILVAPENIAIALSPIMDAIRPVQVDELQEERIKELFGENTQAIRVLAGGSSRIESEGEIAWRSPGFCESPYTGANYRVAAVAIGATALNVPIIVGSKYPNNEFPAPNDVMKEELQKLGVGVEIIEDPDSIDTIAEIVGLLAEAEKRGWNEVAVVTNKYHLPRTEAIIKNLGWLTFSDERTEDVESALKRINEDSLRVNIVAAEKVIRNYDPGLYNEYLIPDLNKSDMGIRNKKEEFGISGLNEGKYTRQGNVLTKPQK
jgi:hypothetical protein